MQQELVHNVSNSRDVGLPVGLISAQNQDIRDEVGIDLSHELRTTLAIITLVSGNLDLLYDRLDDNQRQKMIRDIRVQTEKLNAFIGDVLALCNATGVVAM